MQEPEEPLDIDFAQPPSVALFGKAPIIWYSFLFSTFVGGAIMAYNFYKLRKWNWILLVILGTLLYNIALLWMLFAMPYQSTGRILFLLFNLIGGNLLSSPIWKKTIGTQPYTKLNPWWPLLFVLVFYVLVGGLFLSVNVVNWF